MPVKNGADYLFDCVENISHQAGVKISLMLIINGSSDNSLHIARRIQISCHWVEVVELEKSGISYALNIGINLSKTRYVARWDVDDFADPSRLCLQLERMKRENSAVCFCGARYINRDGKIVGNAKIFSRAEDMKRSLIKKNCVAHGCALFDTRILGDSLMYDEAFTYAQDYKLWLSLIASGFKFSYVDQYLYFVTKHENSISEEKCLEQAEYAALANYQFRKITTSQLPLQKVLPERSYIWVMVTLALLKRARLGSVLKNCGLPKNISKKIDKLCLTFLIRPLHKAMLLIFDES